MISDRAVVVVVVVVGVDFESREAEEFAADNCCLHNPLLSACGLGASQRVDTAR